MAECRTWMWAVLLGLLAGGCSPEAPKPTPKAKIPPAIPTNPAIVPDGSKSIVEVYVVDSVSVNPGQSVSIVDLAGPTLLVANVVPTNVRWKVEGPFQSPAYPASGFVTFRLTEAEWKGHR